MAVSIHHDRHSGCLALLALLCLRLDFSRHVRIFRDPDVRNVLGRYYIAINLQLARRKLTGGNRECFDNQRSEGRAGRERGGASGEFGGFGSLGGFAGFPGPRHSEVTFVVKEVKAV
ncbi:uncharacterized protein EV422DRAFT_543880 [Fimicolochytrium jonesii]|uniref:uncharacterized protein n=1 Tax=Fimicolochytrium jonesii TaxID=1396493 RepID=UPI0022FF200D|nr:uncharacterized protein EV422DRAFT_543880 [Fimicolochytrium jonesii]KAI8817002.1 hypothetical protein EV422DRAFT_543880 [Fimicolochytrium jonesii]